MKQSSHLLLCDGDVNLRTVIAEYLRTKGYDTDVVADGDLVMGQLSKSYYDLCLLNMDMPNVNGLEVLSNLRMMDKNLPVVMLADNANLEMMLTAYEAGCDDYVIKPLSIELLVYKIEAILRRSRMVNLDKRATYQIGSLLFDVANQTIGGQHLSTRESDLLQLLCQNKEEIVDRHQILRALWKNDDHFASRSLCVYVNHLRKFLEGTGARIQAVHGRGYKMIYG